MKETPLLAAMVLAAVVPVQAALRAGDVAPQFTAQASFAGKAHEFSLRDALVKGAVVVYFYPSAYTSGCNVQAHAFATSFDQFAAADASIIGVSLDSIQRLNDFSKDPQYCNGKFPVASDVGGRIARSYDVSVEEGQAGLKDTRGMEIGHDFADRTTFIVSRDGRTVATIGGMSPEANVRSALEAVRALPAGGK